MDFLSVIWGKGKREEGNPEGKSTFTTMSKDPSAAERGHEVLEEGPRRVIFGIISQLRRGMDLHKITLPTFVLEPRSMCERIVDIMSNVDLVSE